MTMQMPTTRNREWGFYGTCASHGHTNPDDAWDEIMAILTDPQGRFRFEPEVARDLLDSTWGRHLADSLVGTDFEPTMEELAYDRKWINSTMKIARAIVLARMDAGQ